MRVAPGTTGVRRIGLVLVVLFVVCTLAAAPFTAAASTTSYVQLAASWPLKLAVAASGALSSVEQSAAAVIHSGLDGASSLVALALAPFSASAPQPAAVITATPPSLPPPPTALPSPAQATTPSRSTAAAPTTRTASSRLAPIYLSVTTNDAGLLARLAALEGKVSALAQASPPTPVIFSTYGGGAASSAYVNTPGLTQKIDQLSGTTLTDVSFQGTVSGITSAMLPTDLTISSAALTGFAPNSPLTNSLLGYQHTTSCMTTLTVIATYRAGQSGRLFCQRPANGILYANASSSLAAAASFVFDSANGRLGIGTSSPADTLAVNGPIYLASTTPSDTASRLYNSSGSLFWNGSLIGGATTGTWSTDGTNVWRASGKVGVGTTSPWANLSMQSSAGVPQFAIGSSTATSFVVDKDGNVGIGTSSPGIASAVLTISGTADIPGINVDLSQSVLNGAAGFVVRVPGTGNQKAFQLLEGTDATAWSSFEYNIGGSGKSGLALGPGFAGRDVALYRSATSTLAFSTGGTQRLTINASGNVGIGTSSPSFPLDIQGNMRVNLGSGGGILLQSTSGSSDKNLLFGRM